MSRARPLFFAMPAVPLALLALSAALDGCVGDAPVPAVVSDGGGADAETGSTDAPTSETGSETGPPTCWGQPFEPPRVVRTTTIGGDVDLTRQVWGPRLVGSDAYFAATPAGGSFPTVFRATWTSSVELTGVTYILPSPSSMAGSLWSPTVSADGALVVVAVGLPALVGPAPQRNLAFSTGSGGTFPALTEISSLSTDDDDADPWLVGNPPTALYFMRGASTASKPFAIYRSAITFSSGVPTFGAPTRVALTCPLAGGDCGTPVVSPREDHMLFGAWPTGTFGPSVQEAALAVAGSAATASAVFAHPELGATYPSWVSTDGCEIIVATGDIPATIQFARRSPK
ncbi:MAG: hypothetical protein JST00_00455 [Deltaproteobacteria bacterium]|nr:hypothetical protein [Deltaproteobacteria bacterium]